MHSKNISVAVHSLRKGHISTQYERTIFPNAKKRKKGTPFRVCLSMLYGIIPAPSCARRSAHRHLLP